MKGPWLDREFSQGVLIAAAVSVGCVIAACWLGIIVAVMR